MAARAGLGGVPGVLERVAKHAELFIKVGLVLSTSFPQAFLGLTSTFTVFLNSQRVMRCFRGDRFCTDESSQW